MKNINYFLILLSFVFVFSACQENGIFFPATSSPSQNPGFFQVTFNGQVFSTENVSFTSDGVDIYINATKQETSELFTLKVDNFDEGVFSFEGTNTVASYSKNDLVSADIWSTINQTASRGNIEFTNIDFVDNRVSGTFNFIGNNLTTGSANFFANGIFTNVPKSDLAISNNTFTAKVDGVQFEEISLFSNLITPGGNDLIVINANKSLTETIGITLESSTTAGEYDFGSFITQTYPTAEYTVDGATYLAEGKITITLHDTVARIISGTFSFDASPLTSSSPNFSITEGEFSVSY